MHVLAMVIHFLLGSKIINRISNNIEKVFSDFLMHLGVLTYWSCRNSMAF